MKLLENVRKEKDDAIASQQYEYAAELREREIRLVEKMEGLEREWHEEQKTKSGRSRHQRRHGRGGQHVDGHPRDPAGHGRDGAPLLHMEQEIHKRIVGQEEAIVSISKAVRRARAGLKDQRRPIGAFLFLGPTGVGKTELVRASGRVHVRQRREHGAPGYVRVPGEAHRCQSHRGAPGLHRLRGGRPAHRGGAPQVLLCHPAGRDREGPPRGVQHPPADIRRWTPERRQGPQGGLPELHHRHDQQLGSDLIKRETALGFSIKTDEAQTRSRPTSA